MDTCPWRNFMRGRYRRGSCPGGDYSVKNLQGSERRQLPGRISCWAISRENYLGVIVWVAKAQGAIVLWRFHMEQLFKGEPLSEKEEFGLDFIGGNCPGDSFPGGKCLSICSDWTKFRNELFYLKDIFLKNRYGTSLIGKCSKIFFNKFFLNGSYPNPCAIFP